MSAPSRRCLSVWLRRLSTDRVARRGDAPGDAPLILVEPVKSALRVQALNDAAAALGLMPGLPLADVRAMYPAIAVREADRAADHALLEAVADWCDRYTPLVGLDAPDGLLLDIGGCAHLFGGERALGRDLIARLQRQGLAAQLGLADTPGAAVAVARHGGRRLVAPGPDETRAALLPLPLAALRLPPDTVAALAQAGLRRIADIAARPRAPLAARYGALLLRRLDQALGDEDESIAPRLPVPAYVAERRFPEPIARSDDVLGAIAQLAGELCRMLERRGEGARRLEAALFRADGAVHRIAAGTAAPLREASRMAGLFSERLAAVGDVCDPGFGYDMVRLSALAAEPLVPVQSGLDGTDRDAALAHLIDRLGARFGAARLTRPLPRDSHVPERAVAAVPAQTAGGLSWREAETLTQESLAPLRPLRLLTPPEPIADVISEVPDGAPAQFRWRGVRHVVAAAEGPERIAMEWWTGAGHEPPRDYFRVESRDGLRAWIFRQDPDRARRETPHWFMHGLFA